MTRFFTNSAAALAAVFLMAASMTAVVTVPPQDMGAHAPVAASASANALPVLA